MSHPINGVDVLENKRNTQLKHFIGLFKPGNEMYKLATIRCKYDMTGKHPPESCHQPTTRPEVVGTRKVSCTECYSVVMLCM